MADPRNGHGTAGDPQQPRAAGETLAPDTDTGIDPAATTALRLELSETKDSLLRALAEQQNIRRQMQRQREEAVRFAASQLAADLLDTLDNLRRAIESVPPETAGTVAPLLKGVEATEANLLATLARHGVERIDPLGAAFDPHRHHAVRHQPDETAQQGTIVEVLQPGYTLNGRVLRPAMVGVAAAKELGDGTAQG